MKFSDNGSGVPAPAIMLVLIVDAPLSRNKTGVCFISVKKNVEVKER